MNGFKPVPKVPLSALRVCVLLMTAVTVEGGSLGGRVTNSNGQSLANVFVDLYDQDGEYFDYTVTGSSGTYQFNNLGSGQFYVHTDSLGEYVEEWFNNVPGASEDTFFEPIEAGATPVTVAYNASVTGVDFALDRAGSIAGRVTDAGGLGIANIYADVYLPDGDRFFYDQTDTNGYFVVPGLPPGTYAVRTETGGRFVDRWHNGAVAFDSVGPTEAGVPLLTVSAGSQVPNVNIQLDAGSEIRGSVLNGSGAPVRGVYVDLLDNTGRPLEFDRSDTNGLYVLKGLPTGEYYLGTDSLGSYIDLWYQQKLMVNPTGPAADGADLVTVPLQSTVSNIDFALGVGGAIAGYAYSTSGQAVVEAFVDVYLGSNFFDYAVTDTNGAFSVSGLPDGTYYAKVDTLGDYLDEWYSNAVVRNVHDPVGDGASPIVVTNAGSVTGLVFELGLGSEITGRVTDTNGQGIAGLYVDLYDSSGTRLFYTHSATNGFYRLGGLPGGTYFLGTDSSGLYVDEWYDDAPMISALSPVADGATAITAVVDEVRSAVDLELQRGGSMAGRVTTTNAIGIPNTTVNLYYGGRPFKTVVTDTNGVYSCSALPNGTYYLRADGLSGFLGEWYDGIRVLDTDDPVGDGADAVSLAVDASLTGLDFVLGTGGVIVGVLKTDAGAAIQPATIDLFDGQGRYYDSVVPLMSGAYAFSSLPPGTWYVGSDTFGAYLDEWFDDLARITFVSPLVDGATAVVLLEGGQETADFYLSFPLPDPVVLRILRGTGPYLLVEWQADLNQAYWVDRCTNLVVDSWTNAPSGTLEIEQSFKAAGVSGWRQYRDPSPPPQAAYRVRSLTP